MINRILEECLRSLISFNQVNWAKCLSAAKFAYNNSFHTSINASPFQLVYGKNLLTPQEFHSNLSAKTQRLMISSPTRILKLIMLFLPYKKLKLEMSNMLICIAGMLNMP